MKPYWSTTFPIQVALSFLAIVLIVNPLVASHFITLDRAQSIYIGALDFAILILCGLLFVFQRTGRNRYAVIAAGGFITLPFVLLTVELLLNYFALPWVSLTDWMNSGQNKTKFEKPKFLDGHRLLGWDFVPNASIRVNTVDYEVRYEIDDKGRRKIFQSAQAKRTLHFFGDSFIFGFGVDVEESALGILAEELHGQVNVANYGVPGYGLEQMYIRMLLNRERIHPDDTVIFAPISADLGRNLIEKSFVCSRVLKSSPEDEIGFPKFENSEWRFPLLRENCSFWKTLILKSNYPIGKVIRRMRGIGRDRLISERFIPNADSVFQQAFNLVSDSGAEFLLLFLVSEHECQTGRYDIDVRLLGSRFETLMQFCPPADTAESVRWRYKNDGHWNPEGNRWAYNGIREILSRRLPSLSAAASIATRDAWTPALPPR